MNILSQLNNPTVLKFTYYSPIDFKKRTRHVIITEEAIKYFKKAADKNDIDSIHFYSHCLRYCDGIDINKVEAIKYYKIGASKGNFLSAYNCACMLYYGEGVDINKDEAFKYFKLVVDQDNKDQNDFYVNSLNLVAYMLRNGDGIFKSKKTCS